MSAQSTPPQIIPETLLGFDFGTKKIGVATGQSITCTATPIAPLPAKEGKPNWDFLKKLIEEWQPKALVVGVPVHMDGAESELTKRARKFANRLHGRFNLPTYLADERLTTFEAKHHWSEVAELYGWPKHFIDNHWIDSLSAALILQSWMRLIESDNA